MMFIEATVSTWCCRLLDICPKHISKLTVACH